MKLKLDIQSYWHAGSGMSGGAYADQLAIKDVNGLPYYPGRSLKGVLKDAFITAQHAEWFNTTTDVVGLLFGSEGPDGQGVIQISNAELATTESQYFRQHPDAIKHLFEVKQSTSIERETGTAKHESLRSIELCIPMSLYADIQFDYSQLSAELVNQLQTDTQNWIQKVCPLIWNIGSQKQKGLGEVVVTALLKDGEQK